MDLSPIPVRYEIRDSEDSGSNSPVAREYEMQNSSRLLKRRRVSGVRFQTSEKTSDPET